LRPDSHPPVLSRTIPTCLATLRSLVKLGWCQRIEIDPCVQQDSLWSMPYLTNCRIATLGAFTASAESHILNPARRHSARSPLQFRWPRLSRSNDPLRKGRQQIIHSFIALDGVVPRNIPRNAQIGHTRVVHPTAAVELVLMVGLEQSLATLVARFACR
jgi:hypothetical protein